MVRMLTFAHALVKPLGTKPTYGGGRSINSKPRRRTGKSSKHSAALSESSSISEEDKTKLIKMPGPGCDKCKEKCKDGCKCGGNCTCCDSGCKDQCACKSGEQCTCKSTCNC